MISLPIRQIFTCLSPIPLDLFQSSIRNSSKVHLTRSAGHPTRCENRHGSGRPIRDARRLLLCRGETHIDEGLDIMNTPQRRLDIEEINDVTVAKFVDRKILDEANIQIIGNQLFGMVDSDERKKIVLDFSNVEYLSSAALGKLITLDKKVKSVKGKLRLCNIRPDIYEVFAITRLNKLFDIRETQDQALQGL